VNVPGELVARDVARISLITGAAAILAALADIQNNEMLRGWPDWLVTVGLIAVSALIFQYARLWLIWSQQVAARSTRPGQRTPRERRRSDRGFLELFAYLLISLFVLAGLAFLSTSQGVFGGNRILLTRNLDASSSPEHVAIFLALLGASFLPLLTAFYVEGRSEARERHHRLFRDDVISPFSLALTSSFLIAIALLAWAAGGKMFSMTEDFGVFITLAVICGFLAVILAPHIARFWNDRTEARQAVLVGTAQNALFPMIAPAKIVSRIDSGLVRLVAPLSGATQKGPGIPHLLLLTIMVLLSALGYVLASPYGLIPIAAAMLIVLSLGRRWAWLEDDRETASRLQSTRANEIYIGFNNDLKDEALLGYAALFILVPLALNQLQDWTHSFKTVDGASSGNAFLDWLRFFGAELAKAVPFVDWWEVYDVQVRTPFHTEAAEPLAKHLTFAARALVDLVIMAALLQAIGIWQRRRTQHRLYDTGQLDFFDPFTEATFFETGMQSQKGGDPIPKTKFRERINDHVKNREALGLPAVPYSQRRLSELITAESDDVRAGASWMIAKYEILAGSARDQLAQLAQRWTVLKLPQLASAGTRSSRERIRREKLEYERVIVGLMEDTTSVSEADVRFLLGLLSETKDSPEFGFGQVLTYELFGRLSTSFAVFALGLHLLEKRHYDERPGWSEQMNEVMGYPRLNLFLSHAEARMRVYDALAAIAQNADADVSARRAAHELLDWMSSPYPDASGWGGDRAVSARGHAGQCKGTVAHASPRPVGSRELRP
jgi:hypothetical protein